MILIINGFDFSEYVLEGGIAFTPDPKFNAVETLDGHIRAVKRLDLEDISISFGLMDETKSNQLRSIVKDSTYITIETSDGTKKYWDARLSRRQRFILNGALWYDGMVLSAKEV